MGVFDVVGIARPPRTKFNLSYTKAFNCDEGQIIPILCEEVVPGDSWKVGNSIVVRFEPTIAPIFTRINVQTYYFFVPYRILDSNWERFITGGRDAADPSAESETGLIDFRNIAGAQKYSLTDYLGFPLVNVGGSPESLEVLPFPWRAYNKIWNEYFRDENFQDEVDLDDDNILFANWHKDYFTSALPWQERGGVSPSFNLMGFAPVGIRPEDMSSATRNEFYPNPPDWLNAHFYGWNGLPRDSALSDQNAYLSQYGYGVLDGFSPVAKRFDIFQRPGSATTTMKFGGFKFMPSSLDNDSPLSSSYSGQLPDEVSPESEYQLRTSRYGKFGDSLLSSRLSAANAGFNINDLRFSFQVQKWLERSARGGYRYTEFLQAMYGVHPRDDRLQRPEFLGGTTQPVVTSEVLQTGADTFLEDPQTGTRIALPTGRFAGHNMSFSRNFAGRYYAQEFGLIMGVMVVRPQAQYAQGINKQWLRKTRYDFFNPLFANLSEQPIESREIYANGTGQRDDPPDPEHPTDFSVFGYQAIYDEMRIKHNMVVADMRPDDPESGGEDSYYYDYWTQARYFRERPILNGSFLQCKPDKRIFAVQDSQPSLIVNVGNLVTAVRPIPYISEPGLIDHH